MAFAVTTERPAGTARIVIAGDLSILTADRARAAIQRAQLDAHDLVCDLSGVTSIDVPGVCVLVDLAARAQYHGGSLTIANAPAIVGPVLRIFGLGDRPGENMCSCVCPVTQPEHMFDRRPGWRVSKR